jgi:hypothetical protein
VETHKQPCATRLFALETSQKTAKTGCWRALSHHFQPIPRLVPAQGAETVQFQ